MQSSHPAPATRRDLVGRGRVGGELGERRRRFFLTVGLITRDRRPQRKKVEHAERLPAPVAPGDAREPIEVDHIFAMGAEIVGHVQYVGLMGQSSNRVTTP